jgi:Uma2 family endonuclease
MMATPSTPITPPREDVVYPESDGKPMGETAFHVEAILLLFQALMDLLAGRKDAYVAADMFLYYEQGNPRAVKAPDVMVIFGVDNHKRRTFKTWVERAVPTVIFEVSSDETYQEDLHGKRALYQRLGVSEYFLFDPLGDCLDPRLQGFRLEDGQYVALVPEADGGLTSVQLRARLVPEDDMLRLIDLRTGQPIPTAREQSERLREQSERLNALAAEVARLRTLLDPQDRAE